MAACALPMNIGVSEAVLELPFLEGKWLNIEFGIKTTFARTSLKSGLHTITEIRNFPSVGCVEDPVRVEAVCASRGVGGCRCA